MTSSTIYGTGKTSRKMRYLTFKSADDALEYAQRYSTTAKFANRSSHVGIIRSIQNQKEPPTYMVETLHRSGAVFKKNRRSIAAAIRHPDLSSEIGIGDLVVFGFKGFVQTIPSGYLLHKLDPVLDTDTGAFNLNNKKPRFRVMVDDHF
ncbi:MAG: hypothetical protein O2949_11115, partial [Proteobacteria bacterium]|nr:hypothetical protein [Pseudomonadota bacterium]